MPRQFPFDWPAGHPDLATQALVLPGSEQAGQTGVYANAAYPKPLSIHDRPDYPKTCYQIFNQGLGYAPNGPCFGYRPWDVSTGDFASRYEWWSYAQIDEKRTLIGSALVHLAASGALGQLDTHTGWTVALWSANRPEWQMVSQACSAYSLVSLSLYDTLGAAAIEYCVSHSESRVVFASAIHIPALLQLADKCKRIKLIVSMDRWPNIDLASGGSTVAGVDKGSILRKWGQEKGITVLDLSELEAIGHANLAPHIPPQPSDMASLMYTSGTTGMPKGAILLHSNIASAILGISMKAIVFNDQERDPELLMSFLPLSHIYERYIEEAAIGMGSAIGYSCGDNLRLVEDIQLLKPTWMAAVPRVLNRVYQAIKAQTLDAPGIKGALAKKAFASKIQQVKTTGKVTHPIWDPIIFNKTKNALGGRMRLITSGSAPISPDVLTFLRAALCCEIQEGYGQTEGTATATRIHAHDPGSSGTVGPPNATVLLKLVDVPEMGYTSKDQPHPRGEICIKGEPVIAGYYKDEKKTQEAIDADGWLHSGDVGTIDSVGRLKIIDRVKNLLKLSQGEYVAVEKVENVYALYPFIAQIFVYGDGLRDHLVAVIVPDPVHASSLVKKVLGRDINPLSRDELGQALQEEKVISAVMKEMASYGKQAKLQGFEKVKQIMITMEEFTQDNDLMTPTLKVKRPNAVKRYKKELDELYERYQPEVDKAKAKL